MVADASSVGVSPGKGDLAPARPRVQSYRFIRAYWTTFQVIFAYVGLGLGRKLFGEAWYDDRIAAAHRRNALRVERTIVQLQGLFIKVGQLLSIMANFLPEQFRTGLEGLQDQVPPRPFDDIERRILSDLGRPVDQVFARFERRPLASASLGQVHEAYLFDGTRVAVKVQHRDIDQITRLDLKTIRRIMAIVQAFVPVQGLDAYYHQIRQMIAEELDFQREAKNIERLAANFTDDPKVVFPRVIADLSTRHVLTATFVEGVKVGDTAAIDAALIDRKELARKIVRTYCQMMFIDGLYHADPHPGNMLARADGSLVLLDFGAVAELSPSMREGIPEFLEGVIRRDTNRLVRALKKMGFLARADDGEVSEKVIEYFHQRFQDEVKLDSFNLKDIKIDPLRGFENLLDLRRMNIGLRELSGVFHVPRDWVLLERTLLLLTGVCTQLDPEMSPMEVVGPYLKEFVLGERDWTKIALEAVKDMALQAVTLPDDLRKYLNRAVRGDLEVKVKGLPDGARLVYAAVRQAIYAGAALSTAIGALILHLHHEDKLAAYGIYGTAGFATLFILSALFTKTRSH
jgi:predicted unusual protein kinase regulating ubiquinone biosynthesis (AarF/ABC1/UbiB family)